MRYASGGVLPHRCLRIHQPLDDFYDKVGNPLRVRDGNGNIFSTTYNALNLPWQQYDPAPFDANFVETLYGKNGRPISRKDRLGRITNDQGHIPNINY